MSKPANNGASPSQQTPAVTTNNSDSRAPGVRDVVTPTEFATGVRGRFTRLQIDPTDDTKMKVEIAAWFSDGTTTTPLYGSGSVPLADMGDLDAVQTDINAIIAAINGLLP